MPPKRRVEELSACWKGTNRRSTSLDDRPIPVSLGVPFRLFVFAFVIRIRHVLDHKLQAHVPWLGGLLVIKGTENLH